MTSRSQTPSDNQSHLCHEPTECHLTLKILGQTRHAPYLFNTATANFFYRATHLRRIDIAFVWYGLASVGSFSSNTWTWTYPQSTLGRSLGLVFLHIDFWILMLSSSAVSQLHEVREIRDSQPIGPISVYLKNYIKTGSELAWKVNGKSYVIYWPFEVSRPFPMIQLLDQDQSRKIQHIWFCV